MNSFNVLHCEWHPQSPWMVDGKLGGRRIRRFFKTKLEAEQDCRERNIECEKFGSRSLPDNVRIQALTAHNMLAPMGAGLIEAADYYVKGKSTAARSETINRIVDDYLLSVQDKVRKSEASDEHYRGLKKVSKPLLAAFGDRLASDIQKHEIVRWIESLEHLSATSKDYYRRYATSVFNYAKLQGYVEVNPCHGIPSLKRKGEIGILTPQEVLALLKNCHDSMIPFYAIGLFAGLRPMSELLLLTADKIHFEDRVIDVENIKTAGHANSARNRYVQISDNLYQWLVPNCPMLGRVVPGNWRDHVYGTRGDRRVKGVSDRDSAGRWLQMQGLQYPGLLKWPHDCMRHSFASYHLAMHQSADKTADQMGHSGSRLVFEAYRRKVKKADAEKFWSIIP